MCSCDRRSLLGVGLALPLLVGTRAALADDACVVFDTALQGAVTPDQALRRLMDGNARLLADKTVNCDLLAQIEATAAGQAPFAAIVGCIDSRVPPELVFDQRLGSVFAARIAGNFVNTDIIGSSGNTYFSPCLALSFSSSFFSSGFAWMKMCAIEC